MYYLSICTLLEYVYCLWPLPHLLFMCTTLVLFMCTTLVLFMCTTLVLFMCTTLVLFVCLTIVLVCIVFYSYTQMVTTLCWVAERGRIQTNFSAPFIYSRIRRCEKCDEGVLPPNISGPSHHPFYINPLYR